MDASVGDKQEGQKTSSVNAGSVLPAQVTGFKSFLSVSEMTALDRTKNTTHKYGD